MQKVHVLKSIEIYKRRPSTIRIEGVFESDELCAKAVKALRKKPGYYLRQFYVEDVNFNEEFE